MHSTLHKPFDWAVRFEQRARESLLAGHHEPLIAYDSLGRDAALSVRTPDHYLPLLYVIAQQREGDEVSFPVEGFDGDQSRCFQSKSANAIRRSLVETNGFPMTFYNSRFDRPRVRKL
jgi:aromatic ring-opening dioxygenase catalytic subunit (LigB family)